MVDANAHAVLGAPFMPPFPEEYGRAVFGMGCFWGADRAFGFVSQSLD